MNEAVYQGGGFGRRADPDRATAAVLAVAVHVVFITLLVFGVNWRSEEVGPVAVELWQDLPTAKPAPRPAREPRPEPPPPPPKPVPKTPVKPEPKPETRPSAADIALKQQKEAQARRDQERLEKERLEKQKKEQLEQQRRLEAEQQAARLEAERQRAAAQQAEAARVAGIENDYKARIRNKIKRFIILPQDLAGNPEAVFDVTLMPSGDVLNVRLARSSGNRLYDDAVERAILKAQPLPLPPDATLFSRFRELNLKFRPNE